MFTHHLCEIVTHLKSVIREDIEILSNTGEFTDHHSLLLLSLSSHALKYRLICQGRLHVIINMSTSCSQKLTRQYHWRNRFIKLYQYRYL